MDGGKRYVNDDRFRVDGDKNMSLLAFAFTIVFVWTGPKYQTSDPFQRFFFPHRITTSTEADIWNFRNTNEKVYL